MSTSIAKPQTTQQPAGSTPEPEQRNHAGAAQSAPKAPAKKGAKARRQKAASVPQGSKTAKVLHLLKRSGGATLKELMKATGWQAHSVRGFLSGTLRKNMGLAVASTQSENRERNYSIKA